MNHEQHLLKLVDVARLTGSPLETVRHWIKTGRLPSVRPGRYRLVERRQLQLFLGRNARGYEQKGAQQ